MAYCFSIGKKKFEVDIGPIVEGRAKAKTWAAASRKSSIPEER